MPDMHELHHVKEILSLSTNEMIRHVMLAGYTGLDEFDVAVLQAEIARRQLAAEPQETRTGVQ